MSEVLHAAAKVLPDDVDKLNPLKNVDAANITPEGASKLNPMNIDTTKIVPADVDAKALVKHAAVAALLSEEKEKQEALTQNKAEDEPTQALDIIDLKTGPSLENKGFAQWSKQQ